jgi:DNA-binding XRE family transcriptional regulator
MQKAMEKRPASAIALLEARLAKRPGYRRAKAELSTVAKVAAKLIHYRQDHALSQAALAAKAGLSRKALNEIEGLVNTNPNLKTLEALAGALKMKLGELVS